MVYWRDSEGAHVAWMIERPGSDTSRRSLTGFALVLLGLAAWLAYQGKLALYGWGWTAAVIGLPWTTLPLAWASTRVGSAQHLLRFDAHGIKWTAEQGAQRFWPWSTVGALTAQPDGLILRSGSHETQVPWDRPPAVVYDTLQAVALPPDAALFGAWPEPAEATDEPGHPLHALQAKRMLQIWGPPAMVLTSLPLLLAFAWWTA